MDFVHEVGEVRFYGSFGYSQFPSYLSVGGGVSDEEEDLPFAWGK